MEQLCTEIEALKTSTNQEQGQLGDLLEMKVRAQGAFIVVVSVCVWCVSVVWWCGGVYVRACMCVFVRAGVCV